MVFAHAIVFFHAHVAELHEVLRVRDSSAHREWKILNHPASSKCIAAVLGINERRLSPAGMVDRRYKSTGAVTCQRHVFRVSTPKKMNPADLTD